MGIRYPRPWDSNFVRTITGMWMVRKDFSGNQVFEVEIYRVTVSITPKMNGILDSQPLTSTPMCTPVHL